MGWLDPPECRAAQDALAKGHAVEAAQVILKCKHPDHRAVRRLRREIGQALLAKAREMWSAGQAGTHAEAAWQMLQWARQCLEQLEGDDLVFCEEVRRSLAQREQQYRRLAAELERAQQLVREGKLPSAWEILEKLECYGPAQPLRDQVAHTLAEYRRHVSECRRMLQAGQVQGAHRHWEEARRILPKEPELLELSRCIAQALADSEGQAPGLSVGVPAGLGGVSRARPLQDRKEPFLLRGLAWVVSTPEVGLGSGRDEEVHVRLLARVHSRHAVLLRDRQGWQLSVCMNGRGKTCFVAVNGQTITTRHRLQHGDRLELGQADCRWEFRQPVPGSLTAVLESEVASSSGVWTGSGQAVPRVVLLADRLLFRPVESAEPTGQAHLIVPDLPCNALVLEWQKDRLTCQADGGCVRVEVPGQTMDQEPDLLYRPCRVVVEPAMGEAELLGLQVTGKGAMDSPYVLEIV